MLRLKVDSRDIPHYKHFGYVAQFPDQSSFKVIDPIELPGEVDCTSISTTSVAQSQTGVAYDYNDLFNLTPHDQYGCDPKDTMKAMVKNGLLVIGSPERDMRFKSYFRGDLNPNMDAFDSVRSTMTLANSPITAYSNWYSNWVVGANNVMPAGDKIVSAHDYIITNWLKINGRDCFEIDAHLGYPQYMSRVVFNTEVSRLGCGTLMVAQKELADKQVKTWMMTVIDLLQNFILYLKQHAQ